MKVRANNGTLIQRTEPDRFNLVGDSLAVAVVGLLTVCKDVDRKSVPLLCKDGSF